MVKQKSKKKVKAKEKSLLNGLSKYEFDEIIKVFNSLKLDDIETICITSYLMLCSCKSMELPKVKLKSLLNKLYDSYVLL